MLTMLLASAVIVQGPPANDPLADGLPVSSGILYQRDSIRQNGGCETTWLLAQQGRKPITVELSPMARRSLIDGQQTLPARVQLAGEWNGETLQAKRLYNVRPTDLEGPLARPGLKEQFYNIEKPKSAVPDKVAMGLPAPENRKYLQLFVRFSDTKNIGDPHPRQWYKDLLRDTYPGISDYYRTVSYNHVTVNNNEIQGWINLPGIADDYKDAPGGSYDVQKLINGAMPYIDRHVDFDTIWGVNVFPNQDDNSGFSYATGAALSSEEGTFFRPVTMDNPWADQFVLVHEMGHNFGFDHSGFGDSVYNNNWSPMGNGGRYYPNVVGDFGTIGNEHNVYHKSVGGWYKQGEVEDVLPGQSKTIKIERTSDPVSGGVRAARVYVPGFGSRYYTIEARKYGIYDNPNSIGSPECVILHLVDMYQAWNPGASRFIDGDNDGDTSDDDARWTAGETYAGEGGVKIKVLSKSASSFTVQVTSPGDKYQAGVVTNTNDMGPGTLREQMWLASLIPSLHISFNIPTTDPGLSSGAFVFRPETGLPSTGQPGIVIDGTTEPSGNGVSETHPKIHIDGVFAGDGANGVVLVGNAPVVKGISIGRFSASGLLLQNAANASVTDSQFGLNPAGKEKAPNNFGIAAVDCPNLTIGGTDGAGNVITGSNTGLGIFNGASTKAKILGNWIGTNAAGDKSIGNGGAGILLSNGGSNSKIDGNFVVGNGQGIVVDGATVKNVAITSNMVGLLPDGVTVGSNGTGIQVSGGSLNDTIGGGSKSKANTVVGSGGEGILVDGATGLTLRNNFVGALATSLDVMYGNGGAGISVNNGSNNAVVGSNLIVHNGGDGVRVDSSTNVRVGGTQETANMIQANNGSGVVVNGSALGVSVRYNAISGNGGLGLDLGNDGVTANDDTDGDFGPNSLVNFPTLTVTTDGADLLVTARLKAKASSSFSIDLYGLKSGDGSGFGEGDTFIQSSGVTTNASGFAAIEFRVPAGTQLRTVSATATDAAGSTSEFSGIYDGLAFPVLTADSLSGSRGTTVHLTAKLIDRLTGTPLTGKPLEFRVNNKVLGNATTNSSGVATLDYFVTNTGSDSRKIEVFLKQGYGYAPVGNTAILTVTP